MKSPNTAFSFAPPSILSLTICKTVALIISKNHACSNLLKTRGSFVLLPLKKDGTEKVDYTVYIWYNVSIKYRRCFYDRTTAEIGAKSIHGNI